MDGDWMTEATDVSRLDDSEPTESKDTSEAQRTSDAAVRDVPPNDQSAGLNTIEPCKNVKSVPDNMNVLKLETEIHNEYFQAPPLGQTLTFQTDKSTDVAAEALRPPTSEEDAAASNDTKPELTDKPGTTAETIPVQKVYGCSTETERTDTKAAASDPPEATKDKAAEITHDKPGSDSPVRQVLHALQSASRGSLSLSRQSPDTADSDDSPSALEMEDIPAGITCVTSEDNRSRPLVGLAAPPLSLDHRQRAASEDLVLDQHLDTACNTSPDGTDLGLSEDEPEMDNMLPGPESADTDGDIKHDESSEEQTYSQEQLDMYLINLHRIDKDVRRCDRTYWYFTPTNLEKLRNIMCRYDVE